jgi:hypothetical protein
MARSQYVSQPDGGKPFVQSRIGFVPPDVIVKPVNGAQDVALPPGHLQQLS